MPHRKSVITYIGISILSLTSSAIAGGQKPITDVNQIPSAVVLKLSDCSEITEYQAEWLNGKNLIQIDLNSDTKMYLSTCERSASQIYSAMVYVKNNEVARLTFKQFIDGKLDYERDTLPNVGWDSKNKTLISIATAGCASEATRMIYKWNGEAFILIEQADGFACEEPIKWKTIYKKDK